MSNQPGGQFMNIMDQSKQGNPMGLANMFMAKVADQAESYPVGSEQYNKAMDMRNQGMGMSNLFGLGDSQEPYPMINNNATWTGNFNGAPISGSQQAPLPVGRGFYPNDNYDYPQGGGYNLLNQGNFNNQGGGIYRMGKLRRR